MTAAYLDEAERCDRVGLMDHGRLIQINRPDAIKTSLPEQCFEVRCPNNRIARDVIATQPGVLSADPSGAAIHVFADPQQVSTLVADYSRKLRLEREGGRAPAELAARSRVWFNPELHSRIYFVPGVLANIVAILTIMMTAMAIVREKEIGTMEQLMVTPIRPVELILGKAVPYALVGLFNMVTITTAALVVFGFAEAFSCLRDVPWCFWERRSASDCLFRRSLKRSSSRRCSRSSSCSLYSC